ncbi:MAG: chemotaxis protein CheC [Methanomassiliicoccus sp.]|nr:chemotaxis protein CheC [Methanomassiliicoccus sp.]
MHTLSIEPDPVLMDGLREIGNIGAAHASTALSNLVNTDIAVEVTEHFACSTLELPDMLDDPQQMVVAVFLETYGVGKGGLLLMFSQEMATSLVDMLLSRPHSRRELDEVDLDAICEVGNICASAYLSAVAKFCGITMVPSPPGVAVDMLHAILQYPAALAEADSDDLMVIRTQFVYGGSVSSGFMLYIPDRATVRLLNEKFKAV